MNAASWKRRLDAIEARRPARDDGPVVVRLRSAPGLSFTRRGLGDWGRNTPPICGAAHPTRDVLASVYLQATLSAGSADAERAQEAAEEAVRTVNERIAAGEVEWLAEAIRERNGRPRRGTSGTMLAR